MISFGEKRLQELCDGIEHSQKIIQSMAVKQRECEL